MEKKYYLKVKGLDGKVQVKGFEKTFELAHFSEGSVRNTFHTNNNGQAYVGVPVIDSADMVLSNLNGGVSSSLLKKMLDATPLDEVTVYEATKINGEEKDTYHITYTKAHLQSYRHGLGASGKDVAIKIGSFATLETVHQDIADDGKTTQFVTKYDLQKHVTS